MQPATAPVQSPGRVRRPVRNAVVKVRWYLPSSPSSERSVMYRAVRNVTEQVRVIKEKCADCHGTGYIANRKKIQVSIPAGIDNGQSVRIRDKGEPGTNGGPRGDLLVEVIVARHPIFQRQDYNIFSTVPISFAVAALGGDVVVDTVDGKVIYEVKPGTQTDTKVRLKGKGVPSLRNKEVRGDHYVTLVVQTPEKLSGEAKELLKQFDALTGDSLNAAKNIGGEKQETRKKKFWK